MCGLSSSSAVLQIYAVLLTVTVHVREILLPSILVTVMTAVPFFSAVTSPVSLTAAISGAELLHRTRGSSALAGVILTVSWNVPSASSVREVRFNEIPVTGCTTVTLQLALTLPTVTLITVLPLFTAFTKPVSLTVATDVSADFHVTASVKFSGVTVSFSCALLPGVGNILLPAVAALISGSVYMLLAAKLQKFGGISIMGLVMGLFFFVSGHFVLSFAANIVCGVLADWVASRSQYRSKKVLLASYVIFSYGLTGPILPLWFMKDAYIANLTARGKDATYIDTLFAPINNGGFVAAMAAILVCAVLGGLFGQRMMKKHFEKAGIVA